MTIAIIAADGRSGKVFTEAALSAGYRVRAGVRGESHGFEENESLQIFQCDATRREDIDQLIDGSDVVVSLIGHGKNSPARLQTVAISHVIAAMKERGMTRIISLTGTGVRWSGDTPSLVDRLANRAIATVDPQRISDGIAHAEVLKQSGLDWTILRVLKLTDGTHTGSVTTNTTGPAELFTPRSRVAAAIVDIIQTGQYIKAAPIITGTRGIK